jgi:hypothetical protein
MSHITSRSLGTFSALLLLLLIAAGSAEAQTSSEEAQGAQLLQSVQRGQKSCSDLTSDEFELIGEGWMGQMFGSSKSHESMNRLMSSMMGANGERQMHEFMGRRVSGCGGGSLPGGFGQMMTGVRGMMGMIGMMGGGPGGGATGVQGGSMMGGRGGYGSMMNGNSARQSRDDDDFPGSAVAVMVVLMALFLVALYFALRGVRSRAGGEAPEDILRRRLAAGEINEADYEQRLKALDG